MPHNKISLFRYYAAWDSFQLVCRKTLHSNKINTPGEHSHDDFYELVIVAAGQGRHRTENSEWIIQPGNVFLIKPRQQHCYTEYDNMIIYNLLFSPSFITRVLPDLHLLPGFQLLFNLSTSQAARSDSDNLRIDADIFPEVIRLLDELDKLNTDLPSGGQTLLISNFAKVMYLIANHAQYVSSSNTLNSLEQISCLLSELQKNYSAEWTLGKMARLCCMSVSSFRQKFTRLIGTSPVDYLLKLRLAQACGKLERSQDSLEVIAFACGFNDVNYFSRQFKKHYKILPSHYRRVFRTGQDITWQTHQQ
ncbi:MAG: helix-turn-helix domain-containing protein [Lentisphaerae bacterium]|nr:helix-turn-helix domain-containing protein [Lentisphaerota bacterium]